MHAKSDGGLLQVVIMVVVVVVAIYTGYVSTEMLAATAAESAGVTAAQLAASGSVWAAGGAANAAVSAGLAGMASSATSQLLTTGSINGGQMFKAGATAALTAGILSAPILEGGQSINQLAGIKDVAGTGAKLANFSLDTLGTNLSGMALRGVATAGVNNAINGGSFGTAFKNSVVSDLAAVGANAVGQTDWDAASRAVAHAGVGCAADAGQGKDCAAGAIGGATASLLNPVVDNAIGGEDGSGWGSNLSDAQVRQSVTLQATSMLASGAVASAFKRDAVTAANAAQNETLNNYLSNWQKRARDTEVANCKGGVVCQAVVRTKWAATSIGQDGRLVSGLALGSVLTAKDLIAAIPEIPGIVSTILESPEVLQKLPAEYSQQLQNTYQSYLTALETAGPDGATAAGVEFINLLNLVAPVAAAGGLAVSASKATVSLLEKSAAALGKSAVREIAAVDAGAAVGGANSGGELSLAAIRARVGANQAESAAARASSNFNAPSTGLPAREWPLFPGSVNQIENDFMLLPGATIDRFGPPQGTFLSPVGTSYSARALKPGTMADDYYVYEVLRPLPVKAGEVRPWFSESGGGMQYRLDAIDGVRRSPSTLTTGDNPYLREVFKGKYGAYE